MPTYQYSCTDCGHFLEAVQSFSDDSLTVCPECEGRLRKVFNAVGVVFKGSGFYRTDSRSANGTNGSSNGSSSGSSEASSGGGKSGEGSGSASKESASSSSSGSSSQKAGSSSSSATAAS